MSPVKKGKVIRLRSNRIVLLLLSMIFVGFSIWLIVSSLVVMRQWITEIIGIVIGLLIMSISIVFLISPMFLENLITPTKLVLRFGLLFRLELPLGEIAEASEARLSTGIPLILGMGVRYSLLDRRLQVLRSRRGIVTLRLKKKLIYGRIFKRIIEVIVLDVSDPEELLRRIAECDISG